MSNGAFGNKLARAARNEIWWQCVDCAAACLVCPSFAGCCPQEGPWNAWMQSSSQQPAEVRAASLSLFEKFCWCYLKESRSEWCSGSRDRESQGRWTHSAVRVRVSSAGIVEVVLSSHNHAHVQVVQNHHLDFQLLDVGGGQLLAVRHE